MKINEVSKKLHITKRAIKYYEEKGLIKVKKDKNGYREYNNDDIKRLKTISLYRKLGINIIDIQKLFSQPESNQLHLKEIYKHKQVQLDSENKQLQYLKEIIDAKDYDEIIQEVEEYIDYETIAKAIQEMVPGNIGTIFMYHFLPYLQITIQTEEQRQAYYEIIQFWDDFHLKVPLLMRITSKVQIMLMPDMEKVVMQIDNKIQSLLNPTAEEYEKTKKMIRQNVKLRNNFIYKYNPFLMINRKFMKQLQNSGYNDIFIPNMKKLSPKYKEYHDALTDMNNRVCADLGLYYDSNYNLILKK